MAAAKKGSVQKPQTKFFHRLSTPLRAFVEMKAPRRNKKDDPFVALLFRMGLNGNNIRSAPDFLQTAYAGVADHGESKVELKEQIDNVSIDLHETAETKRAALDLSSVTITDLVVKEIKSSKGDPSVVLTFQVEYPIELSLWKWLQTHFKRDTFLVFDSTQATLLDLEDVEADKDEEESEDEDQPPLPISASGKDAAAGADAD